MSVGKISELGDLRGVWWGRGSVSLLVSAAGGLTWMADRYSPYIHVVVFQSAFRLSVLLLQRGL